MMNVAICIEGHDVVGGCSFSGPMAESDGAVIYSVEPPKERT
jgi:hypothetical protein